MSPAVSPLYVNQKPPKVSPGSYQHQQFAVKYPASAHGLGKKTPSIAIDGTFFAEFTLSAAEGLNASDALSRICKKDGFHRELLAKSRTNEPLRISGYICIIRAYIEDGKAK